MKVPGRSSPARNAVGATGGEAPGVLSESLAGRHTFMCFTAARRSGRLDGPRHGPRPRLEVPVLNVHSFRFHAKQKSLLASLCTVVRARDTA
jgi:hypothetical protein